MIYVVALASTIEPKNVKVKGQLRDPVHILQEEIKIHKNKLTSLTSARVPRVLPLNLLFSLSHILSLENSSSPVTLTAIAY